jgi:hypothetical protein
MASFVAALLAAAVAGAAPTPAGAQRLLSVGGAGPSLHLEVIKPLVSRFGPFAGARLRTSLWDATLGVPIAGGPTLFARMSLSYALIEELPPSMTVGKPRFGAMVGDAHVNVELHVDLPVGSEHGEDYATGIGIFANYEELERFETDAWSVGAGASTEWETPTPDAFIGVRAGVTVLAPEGATDTYALVGLFAHALTVETRFRLDASAVVLARSGLGFDRSTAFFAALEIARPFSRSAPALFVRGPVDASLDGGVPLVVGLRLQLGG